MESLDFTKPSHSPIYNPAAAATFFEAAGAVETVAAGKTFFVERQSRGFFSGDDRMYLLREGTVNISVAGKSIDTVKSGEIFGEMATITHSPRSATATAKSACRVIALDGGQFQKAMQKTPTFALMLMSIMIDRLRLTLARLTMQKALPDNAAAEERRVFDDGTLDEIISKLGNPALLRYNRGKSILKTGEAGVLMYLPREGRVTITADGRTLEHVGVGGVFGEMALVSRAPRAANAVAETDCALIAVNRTQLRQLVQSNPAFGLSLLKLVAQRLQAVTIRASK
jgi:CRP/FNR family cyclic AMP-dependent transcriptional regulator